jgi:hypothetical protein
MGRDWIVLLEAAPEEGDDATAVGLTGLEEFLGLLADWAPSALYAPNRYAVQVTIHESEPHTALAIGVDRFRGAVAGSGLPVWPLVRAEVKTPAELEAENQAEQAPLLASSMDVTVDPEALDAAYQATRAILGAGSENDVVVILATLVHRLGGSVVPASGQHPHALPVGITFGKVDPLVAVAEPVSIARLRLEQLLPSVVNDAAAMVDRLRSGELGLARRG